jgi:hypothetical protein
LFAIHQGTENVKVNGEFFKKEKTYRFSNAEEEQ